MLDGCGVEQEIIDILDEAVRLSRCAPVLQIQSRVFRVELAFLTRTFHSAHRQTRAQL